MVLKCQKTNDRHMIYSTNCTEIQPPHGANIIDLNLFQQQQQLQAPSSVLRRNSSDSKIVLTVCVKNRVFHKSFENCLYLWKSKNIISKFTVYLKNSIPLLKQGMALDDQII